MLADNLIISLSVLRQDRPETGNWPLCCVIEINRVEAGCPLKMGPRTLQIYQMGLKPFPSLSDTMVFYVFLRKINSVFVILLKYPNDWTNLKML